MMEDLIPVDPESLAKVELERTKALEAQAGIRIWGEKDVDQITKDEAQELVIESHKIATKVAWYGLPELRLLYIKLNHNTKAFQETVKHLLDGIIEQKTILRRANLAMRTTLPTAYRWRALAEMADRPLSYYMIPEVDEKCRNCYEQLLKRKQQLLNQGLDEEAEAVLSEQDKPINWYRNIVDALWAVVVGKEQVDKLRQVDIDPIEEQQQKIKYEEVYNRILQIMNEHGVEKPTYKFVREVLLPELLSPFCPIRKKEQQDVYTVKLSGVLQNIDGEPRIYANDRYEDPASWLQNIFGNVPEDVTVELSVKVYGVRPEDIEPETEEDIDDINPDDISFL